MSTPILNYPADLGKFEVGMRLQNMTTGEKFVVVRVTVRDKKPTVKHTRFSFRYFYLPEGTYLHINAKFANPNFVLDTNARMQLELEAAKQTAS